MVIDMSQASGASSAQLFYLSHAHIRSICLFMIILKQRASDGILSDDNSATVAASDDDKSQPAGASSKPLSYFFTLHLFIDDYTTIKGSFQAFK